MSTDQYFRKTLNVLKMKPYSEYTAEELAMEKLFIRWVRFPSDPSVGAFWESWITKYPEQKPTVAHARELVLTASDWKVETLSSQDVNSLWGRIINSLDMKKEREGDEILPSETPVLKTKNIILGVISMAVLGILCLMLLAYIR